MIGRHKKMKYRELRRHPAVFRSFTGLNLAAFSELLCLLLSKPMKMTWINASKSENEDASVNMAQAEAER
jgi:hypothetical protein